MRRISASPWVFIFLAATVGSSVPDQKAALGMADDERTDNARIKREREARLREMHGEVETVAVKSQSETGWVAADLHGDPVFRYADIPRGILDASLWCWGGQGRPIALCKLEMIAAHDGAGPQWQYCVVSLCEGQVLVTWPDLPRFLATKSGVGFRSIPEVPPPNDKPAGRLRQMKEFFKRFSATILVDGKASLKQEMRQLASPIHRYADTAAGLTDGAIFAFSTNGTNPDVLFLLEATSVQGMPPQWKYAVVGMTYAEFSVRLDQAEIFKMPFPPPFDTWALRHRPRND